MRPDAGTGFTKLPSLQALLLPATVSQKHRWTQTRRLDNRQTGTWIKHKVGAQTDRQTASQTGRQTDRQRGG